jgi:hypothetical protein
MFRALICSSSGGAVCTVRIILYVHGSVHLGNIFIQFKVQLDVLFMYSLFLALHVSRATCTHPQEHNCSVQP